MQHNEHIGNVGFSRRKHRGHGRPRQTAHDDMTQSLDLSDVRKWFLRGLLVLLAFGAWLAWTYVPDARAGSVTFDMAMPNDAATSRYAVQSVESAGGNNVLTLTISQPSDSHFRPDAPSAYPPGWFGRAECLLSSRDILDQTMFEFGATADFLYERDTVQLWVPMTPVSSSYFGWSIHSNQDQQFSFDPNTGTGTVWVGGDATLFNQTGDPESEHTFTVIMSFSTSGQVTCGLVTSDQISLRSIPPN